MLGAQHPLSVRSRHLPGVGSTLSFGPINRHMPKSCVVQHADDAIGKLVAL